MNNSIKKIFLEFDIKKTILIIISIFLFKEVLVQYQYIKAETVSQFSEYMKNYNTTEFNSLKKIQECLSLNKVPTTGELSKQQTQCFINISNEINTYNSALVFSSLAIDAMLKKPNIKLEKVTTKVLDRGVKSLIEAKPWLDYKDEITKIRDQSIILKILSKGNITANQLFQIDLYKFSMFEFAVKHPKEFEKQLNSEKTQIKNNHSDSKSDLKG